MLLLLCCLVTVAGAFEWDVQSALLEEAVKGGRSLLVADCRQLVAGGQLRISLGGSDEEEATVDTLHCPAPGSARAALDAVRAATPEPACDMAELAKPGALSNQQLPSHCRKLLEAALLEQQPKRRSLAAGEGALLPARLAAVGGGPEGASGGVPGVVQLAAGLLFSHAAGASVHASSPRAEQLATVRTLVSCPKAGEHVCAGHGECRDDGTCGCNAGWSGDVCDACASGYEGANCDQRVCEAGCHHGECRDGTCACSTGWGGATCAQRVCPNNCSGHGTCTRVSPELPRLGLFICPATHKHAPRPAPTPRPVPFTPPCAPPRSRTACASATPNS